MQISQTFVIIYDNALEAIGIPPLTEPQRDVLEAIIDSVVDEEARVGDPASWPIRIQRWPDLAA